MFPNTMLFAVVTALAACGGQETGDEEEAPEVGADTVMPRERPETVMPPAARDTGMAGRDAAAAADTAYAFLTDVQDKPVGEIVLAQTAEGVSIRGDLTGLPPGLHGFHIHETGSCRPPFESAGDHFNPTGKEHGLENPAGPHAGDLPNVVVPSVGVATIFVTAPNLTLAAGRNSLFDADSSAIVVHARQDDQVTNPSGNSGRPIACGVVTYRRQPQA